MTLGATIFDIGLCLVLAGVALFALLARDALDSAILFGTFGLLMAVAWLRLGAPDLALIEAVIEMVVILFFGTLGYMRRVVGRRPQPSGRRLRQRQLYTGLGAAAVLVAFSIAVIAAGTAGGDAALAPVVAEEQKNGAVKNPVTAVLLDYRAFDTLLEITVLLVALVGVIFLQPIRGIWPAGHTVQPERHGMPAMNWFAARAVPIGILLAVYLWYAGASEAGGAFQGGAMLGGMVGVIFMTRLAEYPDPDAAWVRAAAAAGVVVFTSIATLMLALGNSFLEYPDGLTKPLILTIEATLTLSIGACLGSMVTLVPGRSRYV
ncbi:hydrogen gas-evolving membrane-bound hydrogenase subunit E [Caenispirillum salinarum]|uniref:hydrogen gas-evolving membrane-bound hydrogenase subunit E n=1 Tax=Caenispirillum salinarum TaxID=859058 RepID=UPI00384CB450